jgi:hypothetical protein
MNDKVLTATDEQLLAASGAASIDAVEVHAPSLVIGRPGDV